MGPLVTKQHFEKVQGYVEQGVKEGAKLVVDGRGVKVPGHENGYFLGACLFDHVKPDMVTYKEEIFGPVLGVVRVKTLEEAMKPHQRPRVRQRHVHLHARRRGGALLLATTSWSAWSA